MHGERVRFSFFFLILILPIHTCAHNEMTGMLLIAVILVVVVFFEILD